MTIRHAVYWTPQPHHPLWRAGCEWLGRDPSDPTRNWSPHQASAVPRRYGFHATLKPPMRLREGASESAFLAAVEELAAATSRFAMPALEVRMLQDFIALRPRENVTPDHALRRLADACVRELDAWRAPLPEQDVQRRLSAPGLTAAQQAFVRSFGCAHVFDHWRFHMTLSDDLPDDTAGHAWRERLCAEAAAHFGPALELPLYCESLCVFVEPSANEHFILAHRFPLARDRARTD